MGRAAGERRWPGATAIVLLLAAGRLYTANAGDCRAVLCSKVRSHYIYCLWRLDPLCGLAHKKKPAAVLSPYPPVSTERGQEGN